MKKIVMLGVAISISFFMMACQKDRADSEKVNDILKKEEYVKIELGENYHQSSVLFALQDEKAVIPKDVKWGLPKYREKDIIGVSFGEEGVETYRADGEMYPELYAKSYLSAIVRLNLTVKEVKDSNYYIKIADKTQLRWFENELYTISTMIIGDSYDLSGVSIEFDQQYRPIKKIFQLKKKDNTMLGKEEKESINCIQEFSYEVGMVKFNGQFRRVKKMIEKN
ncbi:hypothetical protein [Faecalimonas sp.]